MAIGISVEAFLMFNYANEDWHIVLIIQHLHLADHKALVIHEGVPKPRDDC
jgi:hypothetical protein